MGDRTVEFAGYCREMWGMDRRGRRVTQRNMGDDRRVCGVRQRNVGDEPQRTQRYAEEYGG